jgi:peptidoglycan/xylan/chitin deacetylase (PgdA/CDA1 family)
VLGSRRTGASTTSLRRNEHVALGPSILYPAKAVLTRTRSVTWLARTLGRPDMSGLRILFYHRVSDDADELAVAVQRFREQMDFLASEGYRVLDVTEAAQLLAAGTTTPRTVALSFDDAYRDIAVNARPVLAERGFRATVFVATGVASGTASFGWYRRQPPVLDWDEIVRLDEEATFRFEAHSVTHRNLLALDDDAANHEIIGSKLALEAQLGRPVTAFCYPGGLFAKRERTLVAKAGYRAAVSCEPGVNRPGTDPFALRRLQIDARDTLLDFRAKVGGGHDRPPLARRAYRRLRYRVGTGRPRSASVRE